MPATKISKRAGDGPPDQVLMAILFTFDSIQCRKRCRMMDTNHAVFFLGIKNQPKTLVAIHLRDESRIRRVVIMKVV
ncbi:MAG: hypothetical protein HQ494_15900 [Rhodospirillales bacterium]|nr:hypothetical protein [Rhodospirillales bacterium]